MVLTCPKVGLLLPTANLQHLAQQFGPKGSRPLVYLAEVFIGYRINEGKVTSLIAQLPRLQSSNRLEVHSIELNRPSSQRLH